MLPVLENDTELCARTFLSQHGTFRRHLKAHFPLSFTYYLVTHLSASDSFSTMSLYKSIYLLTYFTWLSKFSIVAELWASCLHDYDYVTFVTFVNRQVTEKLKDEPTPRLLISAAWYGASVGVFSPGDIVGDVSKSTITITNKQIYSPSLKTPVHHLWSISCLNFMSSRDFGFDLEMQ